MGTDKVAKDNQLLVIDKTNVMAQRSGYFTLPWVFKHVINKVLTPRELAVGFGNYNWPLCGTLFWPHLS
jgi:hypothetical protein